MKQDRFVFGVEASGDRSSVDTTISIDDGAGDTASTKLKEAYGYTICPQLGFLVADSAVAFIGLDWTRAHFKGTEVINGGAAISTSETRKGFRFGPGLEVAVTKQISLRLNY